MVSDLSRTYQGRCPFYGTYANMIAPERGVPFGAIVFAKRQTLREPSVVSSYIEKEMWKL